MKYRLLVACLWLLWHGTEQRDFFPNPGGWEWRVRWRYVAAFPDQDSCLASGTRLVTLPGNERPFHCLPLGLTPREAGF